MPVTTRAHLLWNRLHSTRHIGALFNAMLALALSISALPAQNTQLPLPTTPVRPTMRVEAGVKIYQPDKTAFTRST